MGMIVLGVAVEVGVPAPDFTLMGHEGKEVHLSDFKGKLVVLEWTNQQCPFVVAHYAPGAIQKLQEKYAGKGVVWLSIISSAPGKQGAVQNAAEAKSLYAEKGMKSTALLLDSDGKVGMAYGAKTTPHCFVIDPQGNLAYAGAIDSNPKPQFDPAAENYVAKALDEVLAGKAVSNPTTKPYGCSIKYAK